MTTPQDVFPNMVLRTGAAGALRGAPRSRSRKGSWGKSHLIRGLKVEFEFFRSKQGGEMAKAH